MGEVLDRLDGDVVALLVNMGIGIIALLTGRTGDIILIAVFGALALYILVSMVWSRPWHAALFAGIIAGCWLGYGLLQD